MKPSISYKTILKNKRLDEFEEEEEDKDDEESKE